MMNINSLLAGVVFIGFGGALAIPDAAPQAVPNDQLTPGAVASQDIAAVCGFVGGLSYSKRHRATPYELKRSIRERDGCGRNSEVDHRLPLALGGEDSEPNLWCQPGASTWTYHDKDRLEVYYWEQVCKHHAMPLAAAQAQFLAPSNWIERYCGVWPNDARCAK